MGNRGKRRFAEYKTYRKLREVNVGEKIERLKWMKEEKHRKIKERG